MDSSGLMYFVEHQQALAFKDVLTLVVSFCALGLSLRGYFQRKAENKLALRKQLTEMLEKITDLNIEVAKYRSLESKEGYPGNYPGILNDQRRFFARQAAYLADRIQSLTSPYEYLLVAASLNEVEAVDQAEEYFRKALEMKNTNMEIARSLAHTRNFSSHKEDPKKVGFSSPMLNARSRDTPMLSLRLGETLTKGGLEPKRTSRNLIERWRCSDKPQQLTQVFIILSAARKRSPGSKL